MNSVLIILFLVSNVGLFWLDNLGVLGTLMLLEIVLSLVLFYQKWRQALSFLCKNCLFVTFVALCNLFFSSLETALLLGLRLGIALEATFLISQLLSLQSFARGVAQLCTPLRIFRVDTDELALSITVALTFVPLLAREARQFHASLKLKGCSWKTILLQPQVYIIGFVSQLFCHVEATEQALRLKGYD